MLPKPPCAEEDEEEEESPPEPELPPHQDRPLLPLLPLLLWLVEEVELRLQTSSANLSCRARAAAHSSDRVGQAYQAPPAAPAPSRTRVMVVARLTSRA